MLLATLDPTLQIPIAQGEGRSVEEFAQMRFSSFVRSAIDSQFKKLNPVISKAIDVVTGEIIFVVDLIGQDSAASIMFVPSTESFADYSTYQKWAEENRRFRLTNGDVLSFELQALSVEDPELSYRPVYSSPAYDH